MHWAEAAAQSEHGKAYRRDRSLQRTYIRDRFGAAIYLELPGDRRRPLEAREEDVEGFNDWLPLESDLPEPKPPKEP